MNPFRLAKDQHGYR